MAGMELIEAGKIRQVGDSPKLPQSPFVKGGSEAGGFIPDDIDAFLRLLAGWTVEVETQSIASLQKNTGSEEM